MIGFARRSSAVPSEPRAVELSPARLELAAAQEAMVTANAELDRLHEPERRLQRARDAESAARVALDHLLAEETARWNEWASSGGRGAFPQPKVEERATREQCLRAAAAMVEVAARDAARVGEMMRRAAAAAERSRERLHQAAIGVLREEVSKLGDRMFERLQEVSQIEAALGALLGYALSGKGFESLANDVHVVRRHGTLEGYQGWQRRVAACRGEIAAIKLDWRGLPERLLGDASATAAIPGGDDD